MKKRQPSWINSLYERNVKRKVLFIKGCAIHLIRIEREIDR